MKAKQQFSFENISLARMAVGSVSVCIVVLLSVILIAQPFLKSEVNATSLSTGTAENSLFFTGIPTAFAKTISAPEILETYSDRSGLYPPDPEGLVN
jgi:hypothetical protein